jgi:glycosyltransferase involved in cell wall biosynthesis
VYVRPRARLRVGVAGLSALDSATGYGNAWVSTLAELARLDTLRLVDSRADVWLASGHAEPPAVRPLVVQVFEVAWTDPGVRAMLHPDFTAGIDAVTRASVAAAEHVVTPSAAARDQVIAAYGHPADRVHVVPLGVDHGEFRPGVGGGREQIGSPYVLFVAVLHPRKNFAAVRAAVADLAGRGWPHVLVVVGNPAPVPDAGEFARQAVAELPGHPGRIVAFRGLPRAQLVRLLVGADLLCLPSWFEGFGLPVLEAMACGTPVVVSDRGSLPEVVGDAGLVVDPAPAAVSEAVGRVVSDPALRAQLSTAGVDRAARFSWTRTAAGWAEILLRLA